MRKDVSENGVEITILGFGVFQLTDLKECENSVLDFMETRYRLVDTAASYMYEPAVGNTFNIMKKRRPDKIRLEAVLSGILEWGVLIPLSVFFLLMVFVFPATAQKTEKLNPILIEKQGSFAVGGTVITNEGTFDPYNPTPEGQTFHGDHAYVFYQIPDEARKYPLVMWHDSFPFFRFKQC